MEQTYKYLLSIHFKHNYFKNGQFRPLQISIEAETQRLLKNLALIVKPFTGGIHLFSLNPELLNDNSLQTPLRIFLECNDHYHINYSELTGYSPADNLLYFNNLDTHLNAEETLLHSEKYVGKNEVALMTHGRFVISKADQSNAGSFQDNLGNDITNNIHRLPKSNEVYDEFMIDNLPEGIIKVVSNGKLTQKVYYSPKNIWKKPLGVIELYIPNLYKQSNNNATLNYILNFNSRSTIWKYFLVSPVYKKFTDLSIRNDKEQVFKPPEKETVQESEALVFRSKNPIALSEFSNDHFQLVDKFVTVSKIGKVVIAALPRASAEQLYRDNLTSNESLYSHIYI